MEEIQWVIYLFIFLLQILYILDIEFSFVSFLIFLLSVDNPNGFVDYGYL